MQTYNRIFEAVRKEYTYEEFGTDECLSLPVDKLFTLADAASPQPKKEHQALLELLLKLEFRHTLEHKINRLSIALARCQSPIEQAMLVALHAATTRFYVDEIELAHDAICLETPFSGFSRLQILPQFTVNKYCADFLLAYEAIEPDHENQVSAQDGSTIPGTKTVKRQVIVECDGHDYHERTKAQAQHDKSRDRFIQAAGYKVFRFTGSEIWKDPIKCAVEALTEVMGKPSF